MERLSYSPGDSRRNPRAAGDGRNGRGGELRDTQRGVLRRRRWTMGNIAGELRISRASVSRITLSVSLREPLERVDDALDTAEQAEV
jgi:hypothetical protein